MRILDFIEKTNRIDSIFNLEVFFKSEIKNRGFDFSMYTDSQEKSVAIMTNYSTDWITHYMNEGYPDVDPVRLMSFRTSVPMTWRQIEDLPEFDARQRRVFSEANAFGMSSGVLVPLHGPFGSVAGVGLASNSGAGHDANCLAELRLLVIQFHTAHQELRKPVRGDRPVHLTPKEREILQWCLVGKSRSVIADILHCSEKTVEWHLSRVYAKLGTSCRVTTVVKALQLGLLQL